MSAEVAKSLNVAIVGYGMTGQAHARALATDGHCLMWAVGRTTDRAEAFAREYGFRRASTVLGDALSDPDLDAVVLCTPSPQHAEQTNLCLEAGKHVLVEIPLAMQYDQAKSLAEAAQRSGRVLMVAHTQRYYSGLQVARNLVRTGSLTVKAIVARFGILRRENVGFSGYRRSWTDSLLWHHACHAVDAALWLLEVDRPGTVEVTSMMAEPDEHTGTPLDLTISIRTVRDQLVTVVGSYNSHQSVSDYWIIGREDSLSFSAGTLRTAERLLFDPASKPALDSVLAQDREFARAAMEGRRSPVGAEDVLPSLEVLQRVQDQEAARAGFSVR